MEDLEKCPFCGSHPKYRHSIVLGHKIECVNIRCPIQPETIWFGTRKLAFSAWNQRNGIKAE